MDIDNYGYETSQEKLLRGLGKKFDALLAHMERSNPLGKYPIGLRTEIEKSLADIKEAESRQGEDAADDAQRYRNDLKALASSLPKEWEEKILRDFFWREEWDKWKNSNFLPQMTPEEDERIFRLHRQEVADYAKQVEAQVKASYASKVRPPGISENVWRAQMQDDIDNLKRNAPKLSDISTRYEEEVRARQFREERAKTNPLLW